MFSSISTITTKHSVCTFYSHFFQSFHVFCQLLHYFCCIPSPYVIIMSCYVYFTFKSDYYFRQCSMLFQSLQMVDFLLQLAFPQIILKLVCTDNPTKSSHFSTASCYWDQSFKIICSFYPVSSGNDS